jgi:toxin-antitoxin system PIN domain toxin
MNTRCWLLDANLLIALTHAAHIHHAAAHDWFSHVPNRHWATCALTQLAFLRLSSNPRVAGQALTPAQARLALAAMAAHPMHVYWADAPEPLHLPTLDSAALVGHRQVTDAYLLGLAVLRKGMLATLDHGLLAYATALGLQGHVEFVGASPAMHEAAAAYTPTPPRRSGAKPR